MSINDGVFVEEGEFKNPPHARPSPYGASVGGESIRGRLNVVDDRAKRLPKAALAKYMAMRDAADAARTQRTAARERTQQAWRMAERLSADIAHSQADFGARANSLDARRVAAKLESDREAAKEVARERQAVCDQIEARTEAEHGSFHAICQWLEVNDTATFVSAPTDVPKRARGESWAAGVDRLRAQVATLKEERERTAAAPITREEAKAAAAKQVAEMAERGRPDLSPLRHEKPFRFAGEHVWDHKHEIDVRHIAAWLDPERLLARICAQIDAEGDDKTALTIGRRRQELARLADEILAAERQEEAFLMAAVSELVIIPRRPDADPRAVLGLGANVPGYEA